MGFITEDEDEFNRLISAHHEAGHAVAHRLAGGRVKRLAIWGTQNGVMTPVEDGPPNPDNVLGYLAMILAGHEAAARFIAKYGGGYSHGQAWKLTQRGAQSDLDEFKRAARGTGIGEGRARREARKVVAGNWGRIHRVAMKLARSGKLSGSQV